MANAHFIPADIDRSLVGVIVVQDDRIQCANAALVELIGCELVDVIGRSPSEFIHADDCGRIDEPLLRPLGHEAQDRRFEARLVRADGSIIDVEMFGSRLSLDGKPPLAWVIVDTTNRKRTHLAIEERLRFEKLLADISTDFVNLAVDQIDSRIDASLRALVEFLGNDRSTFIEFGDDDSHVLVTHSFAVAGCESFPLGPFAAERLPWFIGQLRGGRTVFVRDTAHELPSEATAEREHCLAHGIKSNVTLPLKAGGQVLGGLTFAFQRERCQWPTEIISRLKLIGEVFASALLRRRTEEALRAALAENQKLRQRLEQENLYLREQASLKHHHGRIIGRSDAITNVLSQAERVAPTETPVLVLGETGTGKELLAQTIHDLSNRKRRPMVIVNCACLPATLIESELFGREAGAYTGAASAQVGRFKLADGSTLFLDEIGELPLELQAKMLRVIQDGRFERLGSPKTIAVNVRLIAATNRDLKAAVREGKFRADLYHRLNVFPIEIPPLRQRRDDISPLVWAFVETFERRMGKTIKSIPRATMQQLERYSWPGNVRELSNVIERAIILTTDDTLRVDMAAAMFDSSSSGVSLKETEREQISRVLHETGWRIRGVGGAAERLDIKPTTLEARMTKLGITRPNRPAGQS